MSKSWKKRHQQYTEEATEAIRLVVAALRCRGLKSPDALRAVATHPPITERRVRTLFYRDGEPIVLADEWHALRVRAAALLRREANAMRLKASQYEAQAEALECAQPSLWGETGCNANGFGDRRAA